jgi:hypothetical protein
MKSILYALRVFVWRIKNLIYDYKEGYSSFPYKISIVIDRTKPAYVGDRARYRAIRAIMNPHPRTVDKAKTR